MNVTNLTNIIYITFHLVISATSIVTNMHTSYRSCIDSLVQSIIGKISDICHYLTIRNVYDDSTIDSNGYYLYSPYMYMTYTK